MRTVLLRLMIASWLFPLAGSAQFTITGVTDKATPNDSATLTVVTQAGYSYSATLNFKPIAVGTPVVVNKPDFYELRVDATNTTSSAITSQYLRFIVNSSERVGTEWGLPPHVPFPVIQSCSNEFVNAHLRVMAPTFFPGGLPLPIVAWVVDDQGRPVRANGILTDKVESRQLFHIKRGVGSGFAPTETNATGKFLALKLSAIETDVSVPLASNIVWTTVSGVLNGNTSWPAHSYIQVTGSITIPNGSTLTVGQGSIIRLNSRTDITNNGTVTVNGTVAEPVVFMPATNGQPWGGFVMKTANQGIVNATGTIFTGSGAEQNWFGANGNPGSHRVEQALFFCQAGQQLNLTDSAAVYLSGQLGHSVGATTIFNGTRFLMQRTTSGGEWTGARFTVNDSAFIECPDDSVNFVDGDNDGLYIVDGTHFFTNTLFGWTKDDGIDSGGSGYGPLTYQSCWFEATFHEGNSLSGYKNTFSRDTVYFDCGQGIEDGYNAPTGRLDHCFFSMCKSGIRHGDNYPTIGNYDGRFTGTNCISIYNHRDIFGFNWHNPGGWTNSYDRFWASNNFVSVLDTNYPNNTLWNPTNDAWRLGTLGGVGRVGLGFGARGSAPTLFGDGVPVGLSRFCTNEVRVDYTVANAAGTLSNGTLVFPAGLTRNFIPVPTNLPGLVRVTLANPVNADVTSPSRFYLMPTTGGSTSGNLVLLPRGSDWKYWDLGTDQGTAWRDPAYFDDSSWSNGVAQLGFGDGDEIKAIRRTNSVGTVITTFYFRRPFFVANPATLTSVSMWMLRDDGGVVYLNGTEAYRSPTMPQAPTVINYLTFATNQSIANAPTDNTIDTAALSTSLLVSGTNAAAVEIHQHDIGSSDVSFDFELTGNLTASGAQVSYIRFQNDFVLVWNDPAYTLEEADFVAGPWRTSVPATSPSGSQIIGTKFFRLRK